jgi:putative hydrolase of HD superfamily
MEATGPVPLAVFAEEGLPSLIRAYLRWSHLKQLYRQGWLRRGIEPGRCESVADHSFAVALLALTIADAHYPELNREKVLRLALLHDLAEVYAGDVTPADGVTREEKHCSEAAALQCVLGDLAGGGSYAADWEEYEEGATPEARLVREVDRLEMGLQAAVYERQTGIDLGEFTVSAAEGLSSPVLVGLLKVLQKARSESDCERIVERGVSEMAAAPGVNRAAGEDFDGAKEQA